jgi:L-lysine 6-transaminase
MSVIGRLKQHILIDGFHVVANEEKSHGCWVVDEETGKKYLDCYSQFASQPLGWNHSAYKDTIYPNHKMANSDMYTESYADFVDAFSEITPDFKHYFFIDGGALAVENALKAAFDWKVQVDAVHKPMEVVHFKEAFHGRSGYTMSLTNTDPNKVRDFPKFQWPRITNPKIFFPVDENNISNLEKTVEQELSVLDWSCIASIIVEPIQGEGGDNHFRSDFFQILREYSDKKNAMLIFDEVQTGLGLTGKMWAYEHFGVIPDMMCFGKKTQVCGFCSTDRISSAPNNVFAKSGRINSTWGGNNFDMARAIQIFKAIKEEDLVENAKIVGDCFLDKLKGIKGVSNVRGRGLMIAFDLETTKKRDEVYDKIQNNMLMLKCGENGIRLRPHLDFPIDEVETAISFITEALS